MKRPKRRKNNEGMNNSKIKEILKCAKMGDVIIRDGFDEVVILLSPKNKIYKLTEEEIYKLTAELDKRKIGYEFCECNGCRVCWMK